MLAPARPYLRWFTFLCIFVVVFLLLDVGYRYAIGTPIQRLLINSMTIPAAAWLISFVCHGIVTPVGHDLFTPFGQIHVLVGCEGTEAMFLLIAAILAVRMPWRWTFSGLLGGVLLVFILNILRLLVVYLVLEKHPAWFVAVHDFVAPTAVIVVSFLFFIVWLSAASSGVTKKAPLK